MKKIRVIAFLFLAFFIVNLWSGMVHYVATGGRNLGWMTAPVQKFSKFPQTMMRNIRHLQYLTSSQTYIPVDASFIELNSLTYDVFTIFSWWDDQSHVWTFDLVNLRNDSTLFSWRLGEESILETGYDRPFRDFRPKHTLIMENKSLVVNFVHLNNLIKLDSTSTVIWRNNDWGYHHSMEPGPDGNLWICAENQGEYTLPDGDKFYSTKVRNLDRIDMTYKDDLLIQVDSQTGEVLFKKSVTELLVENNYAGLLFNSLDYRQDPIHLNDIQPAMSSTSFWEKGDLFLSLRNLSSVALYRPSTNKVIWLSQGPFLNQHDVDIISENEISVFNNNMNWVWGLNPTIASQAETTLSLRNNDIVVYDFGKQEFSKPYSAEFASAKINTRSEGLCEFLSNGDVFVEEQNNGKIYVIGKSGFLLKKNFKTSSPKKIHMTNWMRIYESSPFEPGN